MSEIVHRAMDGRFGIGVVPDETRSRPRE